MLSPKKRALLRKLRALYGYDVALLRQKGVDVGDEDAELEALVIYHLNIHIVKSVDEFFDYVGQEPDMQSGAIAVLMGVAGSIVGAIEDQHGKSLANKAAKLGQRYYTMMHTKTLEKNDD